MTPCIFFELYCGEPFRRGDDGQTLTPDRVGELCPTLPFDRAAARLAARMIVWLHGHGQGIPERDLMIAASTIVWGDGIMITGDVVHFGRLRRLGLPVLDRDALPRVS